MVTELPGVIGPLVCVFGKFHLTINFNSYVSCDNFKTKTNVNRHLHFSLENVTSMSRVISIFNVSIDVWFLPSQVTLHVKL